MDDEGQIALEYLLIFAVSLIILIAFTLPLIEFTIENTLDVSDSLKVKSDLSKISSAISQVYGEGQGSRQRIVILSDDMVRVSIERNYLSANLKLNDGSYKLIRTDHNSNLDSSRLTLNKGKNVLVVEWPVGSQNMIIK